MMINDCRFSSESDMAILESTLWLMNDELIQHEQRAQIEQTYGRCWTLGRNIYKRA